MSRYSSPHRDSYTSNLYTSSFPSAPHYSHSTSVSQPRESYPIISSQPIQSQYVVRHPEVIHQSIYHPQDNVKFYPSYSPETTYLTTADPSEHVSPATDFHPTVYVQEPPVVFQHPVPQTYVYQSDPRPIITSGPIYENTVPVWRETVLPSESVRRNQDILELDRVVAEIRSRQARINDLQASARNIISERTQTLSYQRAFPEEAPFNSRSYTASTNYTNNYNDHRGYLDDSEFQDCETTHHREDYDAPRVLKRNTIREERTKNSVQKPKAVTSAPSKAPAKSAAKSPKLIAILGLAVVLFILAFYFMLF